jgi:hypothetical protein
VVGAIFLRQAKRQAAAVGRPNDRINRQEICGMASSAVLSAMLRRGAVILIFLAIGVSAADARRRGLHHHQSDALGTGESPASRGDAAAGLVPSNWRLQPSDTNWKGKRYLLPDGDAWFALYISPADQEPIAAHMRAVTFADGEEITYLRGERDWIVASGQKAGRIFFRKAMLACGGKSWRHIAFEYALEAKRRMDRVVTRAARVLDDSTDEDCAAAVASSK